MKEEPMLSMHPRYAEAVFSGVKKVEFRRRSIAIPVSGRVWVYATRPIMGIMGHMKVQEVVCDRPKHLWHRYSAVGGIDAEAFNRYFSGCDRGYALVIGDAVPLPDVVHLGQIREACARFNPPQFYVRRMPQALIALLEG